MRIRTLELDGIRGLPSDRWEFPVFESADADIIAIGGSPGSGKTTFLEAIAAAKEAIAPYGLPDSKWQWLVPLGTPTARVAMQFEVTSRERQRLGLEQNLIDTEAFLGEPLARPPKPTRAVTQLLGTWSKDLAHGRVVYFHAERDLPAPTSVSTPSTANWLIRLASDTQKYARLVALVTERRHEAIARANQLLEHTASIRINGIEPSRGRLEISIRNLRSNLDMFASNLSTTQRQWLLFALAFADGGLNDSVVLLDSPELGFGDLGAVDLVNHLASWAENIQLVLATTSQALLSRLARPRVVMLP